MPNLAQASSSGGHGSDGGSEVLPAHYPPPYDVSTYVRAFSAYFDKQRFSMLITPGSALIASFGPGNRDTAVGQLRKR